MPDRQDESRSRAPSSSGQSRTSTSEAAQSASERAALASLLYQVGSVLVLAFVLLAILGSLPLALGRPEWIERISSNLQNLGLTGLTGTVLIVLSQGIDRSDRQLRGRVRLVRRLAVWASIGWLALIPLQLSAGFNLVQQGLKGQREELTYFRKVQKRLALAKNQQELRSAIALVPNTPIEFTITGEVTTVGRNLSEQLGRRIRAIESSVQKENDQKLQNFALAQTRAALYSLLLAVGFAAIAQISPGSPSLLNGLLKLKLIRSLSQRLRF